MIETVFIFLILFFSIYFEIISGSFGVVVPFLAFGLFYISVVYGFKTGFVLSLIAGFILGILMGKSTFTLPCLLIIVTIFAAYWVRKGVVKVIHLQVIPGVVIAFIYAFPLLFFNYCSYDSGFLLFLFKIIQLALSIIVAGILMPFFVLVLDVASEKLDIPTYKKAQKKILESV